MTKVVVTVWLDQTKARDSQCHISLCTIDPSLISYRNAQKCIDYIAKLNDNEDQVMLIISVNEQSSPCDTLIQEFTKMKQVEFIYILCNSHTANTGLLDEFSKVRGVFTERRLLCGELRSLPLKRRHRREDFQRMDFIITSLHKPTDSTMITPVPPQQQSPVETPKTNLDQNVLEFLFSKTIQDLSLEEHESSENEMFAFCRQKYVDSPADLNYVEELEEYYIPQTAIFWYTRDIFLYRLLNKALRELDAKTLYPLRCFVKHLHQRLQERYKSYQSTPPPVSIKDTVYRGQLMGDIEFDRKIRHNISGFFSVNSFLSTTQERCLAFVYAGGNKLATGAKTQNVVFEIPIDTSIEKFSYADISKESAFEETEKEILFDMGVIFRIVSITRDDAEDLWIVSLRISDEEEKHVHNINSKIKDDLVQPYKPLIKLIRFMCRMGLLDTAEHFSLIALQDRSVTSDFDLLSLLYYQLGVICMRLKKPQEAKSYFRNTLNIQRENCVSSTDASLSNLYTNLGTAYENIGNLNDAHSYHNLALSVLSSVVVMNRADLAIKYSNIASVCRQKKYYSQALQNYLNCLEIELEILPLSDDNLVITKNNIAVVLIYLENYPEAIKYLHETVDPRQNSNINSTIDPTLAVAYWNLACAFYRQRRLADALDQFRKCEAILCNELNIIFHESNAKLCTDWIQRVENEFSKELRQVSKEYGPESWTLTHSYKMDFKLE